MQQLSEHILRSSLETAEDKTVINLPLPTTTHATGAFIEQLAQCTGAQIVNSEWGADRFQSMLEKDGRRFYVHIEWICEAMWIEEVGQSNQIISFLFP